MTFAQFEKPCKCSFAGIYFAKIGFLRNLLLRYFEESYDSMKLYWNLSKTFSAVFSESYSTPLDNIFGEIRFSKKTFSIIHFGFWSKRFQSLGEKFLVVKNSFYVFRRKNSGKNFFLKKNFYFLTISDLEQNLSSLKFFGEKHRQNCHSCILCVHWNNLSKFYFDKQYLFQVFLDKEQNICSIWVDSLL